jgi:hypothetical protein
VRFLKPAIPLFCVSLLFGARTPEQARDEIIATMQNSINAMARGDVDAAELMDTDDWVSITLNQKPLTKKEVVEMNRRAGSGFPSWPVVWKPDYEKTGTMTGVQIYGFELNGNKASVLYLIGSTHSETIDGASHKIWNGSHARDSWIQTPNGWRRMKHEKLTVNERLIDGHSPH